MLVDLGEYVDWTVKESIESSPIRDTEGEPKDVSYSGGTSEYGPQMPSRISLAKTMQIRRFCFELVRTRHGCQLGEDTRYRLEERIVGKNEIVDVH